MPKHLLIVESPAKAKTISKYLGDDYIVSSSFGHIRDLPESSMSIDILNNYEPNYVISEDKQKVVNELKKLAKKADEILLATDEDREGEAISWHLCHVLGIKPEDAKRVTYTEITKNAILEAVKNPRKLDLNLVNAQQARRVLDRLVGYEISPILWKKVKPNLSAGRVQSVATKLIVEREREIIAFQPVSSFKVQARFPVVDADGKSVMLKAERKAKTSTFQDAQSFLEACAKAAYAVDKLEKKPGKRSPAAPFTTSTLQQEASRKLGYSVSKTMTVAQRLYEAGHITYMRTDSPGLSETAIKGAAKEIQKRYGNPYLNSKQYATKSKGAQEAHEAIRPTDFSAIEIDAENDQQRLYDLIWKRTVASQMAQAETEKTVIDISISGTQEFFIATGEIIVFDGFLKVYNEGTDEEDEEESAVLLPPLKVGQSLTLEDIVATEKYTRPPARYTEASLVKKLEELGIGRPSTYAPTISTIQNRGYAIKGAKTGKERILQKLVLSKGKIEQTKLTEIYGADKNKLYPSDIGFMVNDFLEANFKDIMNYSFTAQVEQQFDDIAEGSKQWTKMIDGFYKPFHTTVEQTAEQSQRATRERILGEHPENGEVVLARIGRYGPMVQIGQVVEDGPKPRFAKMKLDQNIETITLEEALELFKLPRNVGKFEDLDIQANVGRFGPYVVHNKVFVSIPKDKDPYTITEAEAIELIQNKRDGVANSRIQIFEAEGIEVLKGRYGPYIKKGKDNFKIPKGTEPSTLSLDEILALIEEQSAAPKKKATTRKSKK